MLLSFVSAGIILSVTFILYWYISIPKNLPPGPKGLPVLGSTIETWNVSKQYVVLQEWAKKYGPLFKLYIANKLVVILGDYDVIQEALVKQGDVFSGRPPVKLLVPNNAYNTGLFLSEGDSWKEQRRFALTALREFGVGKPAMESHILVEVQNLINEMTSHTQGPAFNPYRLINSAVANVISHLVFGRRFDYNDAKFEKQLRVLTKRTAESNISFLSPLLLCEWFATLLNRLPIGKHLMREGTDFVNYFDEQCKMLTDTYDSHTPPTNYVHAFVKASRENQSTNFSHGQLLSIVMDLFAAGTETTSSAIRWAVLYLARKPELQDEIYKELQGYADDSDKNGALPNYSDRWRFPLTEATVMETLRISSISPLSVMHKTMAPTKLHGYDIPQGAFVIPLLWSVLSDPDKFPNPEEFNPHRFMDENGKVKKNPSLIPFSSGKRVCIAEGLVHMEMFMFIAGLFSKFRFFYPLGDPMPTLQPGAGFVRAPTPYQICIEPRC